MAFGNVHREAGMKVLLTSGLLKVLLTATVLTAAFLGTMFSISHPPASRFEGSIVVAQRFCPNDRC
jgi:hypothetical protein